MREEISSKQAITLVLAFILDAALIFPTATEAGRNSWISVIIAIMASFIIFTLYYRIQLLYPDRDFYLISQEVMGGMLGRIFNILYIWYFLHLGALTLRDFGEFMSVMTMPETPRVAIGILSILTAVYMTKKGCNVIGKFSLFASIATLITLGILFMLILPKVNIKNILPVMSQGIQPVLTGAWSAFTFPFGECIIFTVIFAQLKSAEAIRKSYFIGLTLGGIVLLINTFLVIAVLSEKVISFLYFPFYTMLSRIRVGEFIQRLEIVGGIILNVFGIIKISLCLYAASLGISRLIKLDDYKVLLLPVALLMLTLTNILYDNVMELVSWTAKYYKYYALPFEIFIPVIIFIAAKVKRTGTRDG
jgi:spore germination protein KB